MSDSKDSWLAQIAKENDWPMLQTDRNPNAKSGREEMMMGGASDKDQKTADDLDREIRSLKTRIDRLSKNEKEEKKVKELKTLLANREKKFAAQMELLAKKAEQSESSDKANADKEATGLVVNADRLKMNALIEEAYLRTLSRMPSASEIERSYASISQSESPTRGLSDLLWALINSKEFILNH
jgi:TolA-binding protein